MQDIATTVPTSTVAHIPKIPPRPTLNVLALLPGLEVVGVVAGVIVAFAVVTAGVAAVAATIVVSGVTAAAAVIESPYANSRFRGLL